MNNPQTVDQLPREIDVYPMSSIELFERAFCTNFSCCNILFPDLHALLDHYDATTSPHSYDYLLSTPTLVTTPPRFPSSPLSSPPSSPSTHNTPDVSPSHSRPASLVCPTTDVSPDPGFSNLNHNRNMNINLSLSLGLPLADAVIAPAPASMANSLICHPDAYALADYPTYEHCYDTAMRYLAGALKPATESSAGTDTGMGGANKPRRGRRPLSASSSSSLSQYSSSSSGTAHQYRKKKGKTDFPGKRSRKAYQCPIPGCSKSYLNPNGLKYHQEKGKCKIELPIEVKHSNSTFTSAPAADADVTTGTGTNTATNPPTAPAAAPVPPGPKPPIVDIHDHQQYHDQQEQQEQDKKGHEQGYKNQQHIYMHHPQPRHATLQWSPSPDEVPRVGELGSESELESEAGFEREAGAEVNVDVKLDRARDPYQWLKGVFCVVKMDGV